MANTAPFPAYRGQGEFVFASYAHRDSAIVYPILAEWHRAGVAIWYDEGIEPGREWPQAIGEAVMRAARFVVFISPESVRSLHVRNEIGLAVDNRKPVLAIHLTETELPAGLMLRLSQTQAIRKYEQTEAEFQADVRNFFSRSTSLPPAYVSASPGRKVPLRAQLIAIGAGVVALIALVVGLLRGRADALTAEAPNSLATVSASAAASGNATPAAKLDDGELTLPVGRLHFVSDGNPMEKKSWLRLGDKDVYGYSPPTAGGSVEWFDLDTDGSYRALVLDASAGNACVGQYRLLRVRSDRVETWSDGFAGCRSFVRVDHVAGGLDFLFGGDLLGKLTRVTLRAGNLANENGAALSWASPTLLLRTGQHPAELLVDAEIGARFRKLLGAQLEDFAASLTVASDTQVLDGWLTGSGCAPHECGTREGAFFIDPFSETVCAATLRDGVATLYLPEGSSRDAQRWKEWAQQQWPGARQVVYTN
ncbi:MAG TPA: toll/interleukin-1 receptor domain-containing protein [Polyangiaceae bacterium]|nr:toll/interleukin-1 receptor domain-containing protein [Polyangiaceae bacterium]